MKLISNLIKKLPAIPGLRVLMYHKVSKDSSDILTVKSNDFYEQMISLMDEGYHFLHLSELHQVLKEGKSVRPKTVMVTFDDAYVNNRDLAAPILEKLNLKYSIFLPVGHLGKVNSWDEGKETLLSFDELRKMKNRHVEYGLHSFHHKPYTEMSLIEVKADLKLCQDTLKRENVSFVNSLAYPYGIYPRNEEKDFFFQALRETGIESAFRIGNSVNTDLENPFELKRVDVQGQDSLDVFRLKVRLGKIKL